MTFHYLTGERRPVEILVFEMAPDDVADFLAADHEIWTLREAHMAGLDRIPMLSKEIWLNDHRPGEVTIVIEWESMEQWRAVDDANFQAELTAEFDARFARPYRLVRAVHEDEEYGIHRWSRFERTDQ